MRSVKLYDTTLRDGAQMEGVSFTVKDKIGVARKLNSLGIHYIEGGWPGSNPKDIEFFKEIKKFKLKNSRIAAFGSTRRPNTKVSKDPFLQALLKADTSVVTIFGKSWGLHVRQVLRTTPAENLRMIAESVEYFKHRKKGIFYDAEHFFDGYREDSDYALKTLRAAENGGCDAIILCDTNGGTITSEIRRIVMEVAKEIRIPLGIHAHNDINMAVANSVAAVQAGCIQVQGTINGYGERCGNADFCSVIPTLRLKLGINCLPLNRLKKITEVSRFVSEVINAVPQANQPYVGHSAFAHKGGIHVDAVSKTSRAYEHIEPEQVGNLRRILVSELAGKSNIIVKAKQINLDLKKDPVLARSILNRLKKLEHEGYEFEAAEGSFELLMKKILKRYKRFFTLEGFRVIIEKRDDQIISEATIKLRVKNRDEHTASLGNGPVNALDNALRKALKEFYPTLAQMHLSDYKVRVLDSKAGTAAKVRVLIESRDAKNSWWTVGVSENIIEASWQALVDSIEYKLLKDKV